MIKNKFGSIIEKFSNYLNTIDYKIQIRLISNIINQWSIVSSLFIIAWFIFTEMSFINMIGPELSLAIMLSVYFFIYRDCCKESNSIIYRASTKINIFLSICLLLFLNYYLQTLTYEDFIFNRPLSHEEYEQLQTYGAINYGISGILMALLPLKYCASSFYYAVSKEQNSKISVKFFNYLLYQAKLSCTNGELLMSLACKNQKPEMILSLLQRYNKYRFANLAANLLKVEMKKDTSFAKQLSSSKEWAEINLLCIIEK